MDPIPRIARLPQYLPLNYDVKYITAKTKESTLAFDHWMEPRQIPQKSSYSALCEVFDTTSAQYQAMKTAWKVGASASTSPVKSRRPHPSSLSHLGGADSSGNSMASLHLSSVHLPLHETGNTQSAFSTTLASPASPHSPTSS